MTERIKARWTKLQGSASFRALLFVLLSGLSIVALLAYASADSDHDGVPDDFESFFGLDPLDPTDAAVDPDGDFLSNLDESRLWTDPFVSDTDGDGWIDSADESPLSRAYIQWGAPSFTTGDEYRYPGPEWWVSAFKIDGVWQEDPCGWRATGSSDLESVNIELDRSILTNDVTLEMSFLHDAQAALFIDLYASNCVFVATNLFGNLFDLSGTADSVRVNIPLRDQPEAIGIHIRHGEGDVTLLDSLLYVDRDGDFLDEEQERQLETSDQRRDSDGDGLTDFDEVFLWGTDPCLADTDGDGVNDGLESAAGNDPLSPEPSSALPFFEHFEPDTVALGDLDGQHGWTASPEFAAVAQTQIVCAGAQALAVMANSGAVAEVSHRFSAPDDSRVWVDLRIQGIGGAAPTGTVTDAAALYFDGQGRLTVCDGLQAPGEEWVTLWNHEPVGADQWVRLTVMLDYALQRWDVYLDGILLAEDLGFSAPVSVFGALAFEGQRGWLDDIQVVADATILEIHALSGAGGTITPEGEVCALEGADQLFTITPEPGYRIAEVVVDGDSQGSVSTYTFRAVAGDHVIAAVFEASPTACSALPFSERFEPDTVALGDLDGQNKWLAAPAGTALVQDGTVYEGARALAVNGGLDRDVTARHMFDAAGEREVWVELRMQGIQGAPPSGAPTDAAMFYIDGQGRFMVYDGLRAPGREWVSLRNHPPIAADEWTHVKVRLDYEDQVWDVYLDGALRAEGLGFAAPVAELERLQIEGRAGFVDDIHILCESSIHTLLASAGFGGTITPEGEIRVIEGADQTFTVTPESGYRIAEVVVDGDSQGSVSTYTFRAVAGDHMVVAVFEAAPIACSALPFSERFEPDTVALGDLDGQNKWLAAPAGTALVQDGTVYEGARALAVNGGLDRDVTARHMFDAAGEREVWVELRMQGIQGAPPSGAPTDAAMFYIDGQGRLTVYDGLQAPGREWVSLRNHPPIAADEWAHVKVRLDYEDQVWDVYLDGALRAEGLGFAAPVAELERLQIEGRAGFVDDIHILCESSIHTLLASAGFGGTITPEGEIRVIEGADQTFTVTPESGYRIAEVVVDGDSQGSVSTYTFRAVAGDHVIAAVFEASPTACSALPFAERFELDTVALGDLDGQNKWLAAAAGTALVQDGAVYEGDRALGIVTASNGQSHVRHMFDAGGESVIWFDLYMRGGAGGPPVGPITDAAVFYFDSQGRLTVYDGARGGSGKWVTLENHPPVTPEQWARVTARVDYARQVWDVYLDGILAAAELGFGADLNEFSALEIEGEQGFVDYVTVVPDGMIHTISASAGAGGAVMPDGDTEVMEGAGAVYAIVPDNGYRIADVWVDGAPQGAVSNYTFAGVAEDHTITARFEPRPELRSPLPFIERFEPDTVALGDLNGQNDWRSAPAGAALVQSDRVYEGTQALRLRSPDSGAGRVWHFFDAAGTNVVWVDFRMQGVEGPRPAEPLDGAAALFFDGQGRLCVYDGPASTGDGWVALTNHTPVARDEWVRVTARLDYGAQTWDVYLDGYPVAQDLGFAAAVDQLSELCVEGQFGYLDSLTVGMEIPSEGDLDEDGMPDYWEILHLGSVLPKPYEDDDGDGLPNMYEYVHGTDPSRRSSCIDPMWHVDAARTTSGDGKTPETAFRTIQEAVDAAVDYDFILVAAGLYAGAGNVNIDLKGKILILRSAAGPGRTLIDVGSTPGVPGFVAQGGEPRTTLIDGFRISHARRDVPGGGMDIVGASPSVWNCEFSENTAWKGGGVSIRGVSAPILQDCDILGNTAQEDGGGIFYDEESAPWIRRCTVSGNRAGNNGAGICGGSKP